ncbi:hypothetical protein WN944_021224 [Citrus x changshan-huyou]|uniref:Uncharacterized protein n=1 Tax=Citrus x changshan-huyou TaxID=2935761 RepID=A0AAP0N1G1_9ROSI
MVGQLCSITITPACFATRHPSFINHHVTRTTAPPPLCRLISSVHNTVSLPPCLLFIVRIIKLLQYVDYSPICSDISISTVNAFAASYLQLSDISIIYSVIAVTQSS